MPAGLQNRGQRLRRHRRHAATPGLAPAAPGAPARAAAGDGQSAAVPGTAAVSSPVIYVVSLFPCWSETFIVREIQALLRLFLEADLFRYRILVAVTGLLAIFSMLAGNLLALLQTNIKRMLAYSSIAHIGYLLIVFMVCINADNRSHMHRRGGAQR